MSLSPWVWFFTLKVSSNTCIVSKSQASLSSYAWIISFAKLCLWEKSPFFRHSLHLSPFFMGIHFPKISFSLQREMVKHVRLSFVLKVSLHCVSSGSPCFSTVWLYPVIWQSNHKGRNKHFEEEELFLCLPVGLQMWLRKDFKFSVVWQFPPRLKPSILNGNFLKQDIYKDAKQQDVLGWGRVVQSGQETP